MNFALIKKTLIFSTTALWLWSPFAFSQQAPIATTELSSDSFIRFKDNINMNCRSASNLSQVNTVLGAGSVIQLPRGITEYDKMDGGIDFNKTIENWRAKSQMDPKYHSHRPIYLQCPDNKEECQEVDSSEPYLPIKVAKASDPNFNTDGAGAICYVALDFLKRNIDPSRYQTVRTTLQSALALTNESNNQDVIAPAEVFSHVADEVEYEEDSEVTDTAPSTSLRPVLRPESVSQPHESFRCRQSGYQAGHKTYTRTNCFAKANLSLKRKAEIIMKDVMEINRRRNGIKVDPRYSACIAYKESTFSPNALGGKPDYGLFQVINSTAKRSLEQTEPVAPGFSRYRNYWAGNKNQPGYRELMLNSTLAQADLHHSVLTGMVKWKNHSWKGLFDRFYRGVATRSDYFHIAGVYNKGGSYKRGQAVCYNSTVIGCFDRMKKAATSNGAVINSDKLKEALMYTKRSCRDGR